LLFARRVPFQRQWQTALLVLGGIMAHAAKRARRGRPLVAILGGSFDPITDAHLKTACEIIHSKAADKVWIVPCGARPDKPSLKTSPIDRLIMCHLAVNTMFGSQFPIEVKDFEIPLASAAPTIHMSTYLKGKFPGMDFTFVIGTDLVESLESWTGGAVPEWEIEGLACPEAGQRLFRECRFLVINRPGYEVPKEIQEKMADNFTYLVPLTGTTLVTQLLSSSEVRARIKMSDDGDDQTPMRAGSRESVSFSESERGELEAGNFAMVEGLVSPAVLAHIIRYKLYCS